MPLTVLLFLFRLGQSSASLGVGDVLLRLSANVSRRWSVFLRTGFISCYLVILITKMPGNVEAQLHSRMSSLNKSAYLFQRLLVVRVQEAKPLGRSVWPAPNAMPADCCIKGNPLACVQA